MRSLAVAVALSLVLGGAPLFVQSAQAQAAQTQPPAPFPEGAKIAVVNIQRVANESAEGKAATAKVQTLHQQKMQQLTEMNKKLQADQQKLQTQALVMNDQARAQLDRDIDRQQKEIQRFSQDAQEEVQNLQQDLQESFHRQLMPILQKLAQAKGVQLLLSLQDAGIVWWDEGLDITADVVKELDAASTSASAGSGSASSPQ